VEGLQAAVNRTLLLRKPLLRNGKNQVSFAEVPLDQARDYAAEDADIALQLAERFEPEIERLGLAELMHRIEMPLVEVLAEMEWAGIRIDETFFGELSVRLRGELLFEVPRGEEDKALRVIRERMESAAELRVPLRVETGIGGNWLECK
jgi:DNA polymerase I-like protein with 3'-5' exonuclease and polymerase domains